MLKLEGVGLSDIVLESFPGSDSTNAVINTCPYLLQALQIKITIEIDGGF